MYERKVRLAAIMSATLSVCAQAVVFFPCFSDGTRDERTLHEAMLVKDPKWISQVSRQPRSYTRMVRVWLRVCM